MENLKEYAVIFTYNFDNDSQIFLFGDDYEGAKQFLEDSYKEELRIEIEENGWEDEMEYDIDENKTYAQINHFVSDGVDTCEYRLCTHVERRSK